MNSDSLKMMDADGAIFATAHDTTEAHAADGDTRADFFKKAGIAGAATLGGGTLMSYLLAESASASGRPPSSFGKGDIGILNFALTLEYLESAFYNEASKRQASNPWTTKPQLITFLRTVTLDERVHVAALEAALGKNAVKKPKFDFGNDTSNEAKFMKAAFAFENEGVHAYLGQAFNIKERAYAKVALSIVTIEARHAAVIGLILKNSRKGIAPNGPFDKPFSAKRVLKDVGSLGYIQ